METNGLTDLLVALDVISETLFVEVIGNVYDNPELLEGDYV